MINKPLTTHMIRVDEELLKGGELIYSTTYKDGENYIEIHEILDDVYKLSTRDESGKVTFHGLYYDHYLAIREATILELQLTGVVTPMQIELYTEKRVVKPEDVLKKPAQDDRPKPNPVHDAQRKIMNTPYAEPAKPNTEKATFGTGAVRNYFDKERNRKIFVSREQIDSKTFSDKFLIYQSIDSTPKFPYKEDKFESQAKAQDELDRIALMECWEDFDREIKAQRSLRKSGADL